MSTTLKAALAVLLLGACLTVSSPATQARAIPSCCPPPPPKTVVLLVCHPCTHCKYEIPVCIPACVDGVPSMCFHRTLVGQGKTVFEWPCGYQVVVRYNHHGYRVVQRDR